MNVVLLLIFILIGSVWAEIRSLKKEIKILQEQLQHLDSIDKNLYYLTQKE